MKLRSSRRNLKRRHSKTSNDVNTSSEYKSLSTCQKNKRKKLCMSTTQKKVADFIWERFGSDLVECSKSVVIGAFDVIGQRVTESLGGCFTTCEDETDMSDKSYSSGSYQNEPPPGSAIKDTSCMHQDSKDKSNQLLTLKANETICRYCNIIITKNGTGGHEKNCAKKCNKQWVPRGEDLDFATNVKPVFIDTKRTNSSFDSFGGKKAGSMLSKDQRPVRLIQSFDTVQKPTGLAGRLLKCVKYVDDGCSNQTDSVKCALDSNHRHNSSVVKGAQQDTEENGKSRDKHSHTSHIHVLPNMVDTDEIFQCVVLHPYRMAQILGAHAREKRSSLLKDYWEIMDPEGFLRTHANVQPVIHGSKEIKECAHKIIDMFERGEINDTNSIVYDSQDVNMKNVIDIICNVQDKVQLQRVAHTKDTVETNKKMGRACEKLAISMFEKERNVRVIYNNTSMLYDMGNRRFEPCGISNRWRLKGVLDGKLDDDTIIEVKTRRYNIKDVIPAQDMYQIQTYMEMFNAQKCVHIEYHEPSRTVHERIIMRDTHMWETEIRPGIEKFVKNIHMLLTNNPKFNYYKLFISLV